MNKQAYTINGKVLAEVTMEEALSFLHDNKSNFHRTSGQGDREFDCLVFIMEEGTIKIEDLPSYGVTDQEFGL